MSTATDRAAAISREMPLSTWADRIACAQRIIQETGDLPEGIWYTLWYGQDEVRFRQAAEALQALRPAGAPPYKGAWV